MQASLLLVLDSPPILLPKNRESNWELEKVDSGVTLA